MTLGLGAWLSRVLETAQVHGSTVGALDDVVGGEGIQADGAPLRRLAHGSLSGAASYRGREGGRNYRVSSRGSSS